MKVVVNVKCNEIRFYAFTLLIFVLRRGSYLEFIARLDEKNERTDKL